MATYLELFDFRSNSSIVNRVAVACVIAADLIRQEAGATPNHANRIIWAKQVLENPESIARNVLWGVLAANKNATPAQITAATDETIQTAVNNIVDLFAQG